MRRRKPFSRWLIGHSSRHTVSSRIRPDAHGIDRRGCCNWQSALSAERAWALGRISHGTTRWGCLTVAGHRDEHERGDHTGAHAGDGGEACGGDAPGTADRGRRRRSSSPTSPRATPATTSAWPEQEFGWDHNLIALDDFSIGQASDPLFETFTSTGLTPALPLSELARTIFDKPDLVPEVHGKHTLNDLPWHLSDHYPLCMQLAIVQMGRPPGSRIAFDAAGSPMTKAAGSCGCSVRVDLAEHFRLQRRCRPHLDEVLLGDLVRGGPMAVSRTPAWIHSR